MRWSAAAGDASTGTTKRACDQGGPEGTSHVGGGLRWAGDAAPRVDDVDDDNHGCDSTAAERETRQRV